LTLGREKATDEVEDKTRLNFVSRFRGFSTTVPASSSLCVLGVVRLLLSVNRNGTGNQCYKSLSRRQSSRCPTLRCAGRRIHLTKLVSLKVCLHKQCFSVSDATAASDTAQKIGLFLSLDTAVASDTENIVRVNRP
jgi:hypothetical protein